MQFKRRSGRIAKELPIVLLGTDTTGKVFAEQTKTVVLSRHGAGIVSRYRFAPDEVLSLRLPGTPEEAEVRLVGQIGGEPGRYVYGVAFVNSDKPFWPMEFPPPEPDESPNPRVALECSRCQTRQNVEQADIEEDVYSVNGYILRFCENCGISTTCKKDRSLSSTPSSSAQPVEARVSYSSPAVIAPSIATASITSTVAATVAPSPLAESPSSFPIAAQVAANTSFAEPSTSTGVLVAQELQLLAPLTEATALPTAAPVAPSAVLPRSTPAVPQAQPPIAQAVNGRRANRRRHVRVKVSFNACVRHPGAADEIVECEDMSKGGLCFHSRKEYPVGAMIELAAPFSPGEPALFVNAQIKRADPLPGTQVIRYGVEYVKAKPSPRATTYSGSN